MKQGSRVVLSLFFLSLLLTAYNNCAGSGAGSYFPTSYSSSSPPCVGESCNAPTLSAEDLELVFLAPDPFLISDQDNFLIIAGECYAGNFSRTEIYYALVNNSTNVAYNVPGITNSYVVCSGGRFTLSVPLATLYYNYAAIHTLTVEMIAYDNMGQQYTNPFFAKKSLTIRTKLQ